MAQNCVQYRTAHIIEVIIVQKFPEYKTEHSTELPIVRGGTNYSIFLNIGDAFGPQVFLALDVV